MASLIHPHVLRAVSFPSLPLPSVIPICLTLVKYLDLPWGGVEETNSLAVKLYRITPEVTRIEAPKARIPPREDVMCEVGQEPGDGMGVLFSPF